MGTRNAMASWARYATKHAIWSTMCRHSPSEAGDIVIFTTGRSGGTWLTELLAAEPGLRSVGQPLSVGVDDPFVRREFTPDVLASHGFVEHQRDEAFLRRYLRRILDGEVSVGMPWDPRADDFPRSTNRVVLRENSLKAWIGWFSDEFPDAKIVYLVRHPASFAMSSMKRDWVFRSASFLDDAHFVETHLDPDQVRLSREIFERGERIEKFIASWCIQNIAPLSLVEAHPDWCVVAYEELLVQPGAMAALLADRLGLESRNEIESRMGRRSRTSFDAESARMIEAEADPAERLRFLLGRWQDRISEEDKARCARVLDAFGIEDYSMDRISPSARLLNLPESIRDLADL